MKDNNSISNIYIKNFMNGVYENDLRLTYLNTFKFQYKPTLHIVKYAEIGRPDLISFVNYAEIDYWYIILYYNNIDSPYDLYNGQILKIPSIKDITDFFSYVNLKRR